MRVHKRFRNSDSHKCVQGLRYDKNQNDDADRKGVMRAPKELAHRLTTPGAHDAPLSPKLLDYVNNHRLRTLIIGTIGSIMVTLGSYAVGWLADSSSFWRYDIIRAIRFEAAWVITGIIMLALGAMLMCREWLRIYQKMGDWNEPNTMRWMIAVITSWSLPQVFAFTIYSRDMFSYYGQGMVMAHGLNPYKHGVSEISNFMQNGADPMWAESPPPYGPVSLKLEEWIVRLAGENIDLSLFYFRLLSVLAVIGILFYVAKLAQAHGFNQVRALWQIGPNPLFIASFIASGHNDSLMTMFMLGGLYYAKRYRDTWWGGPLGVTFVALGVAVKPLALVVLPFVGLLWAGKNASWPRKFIFWALSGVLLLAEMALMGWATGLEFGWIKALSTTGGQYIWYTPFGLLIGAASLFVQGEAFEVIRKLIETVGKGIGMLGAVAMAFVGRDRNIVRHAGLAILFMLLCSPMIQPWYLLWAIPMLAATGLRSHFQLMWYFITTLFFMAYGVSDQLNVSPYLRDFNQDMGRLIATVICLGYIIYLVALDPATRRLVYVSLHPTQIRRTTIRLWWQLFPGASSRRARRREVKKAEREAAKVGS